MTDRFHIHVKTTEHGYTVTDVSGQKEGVDPKTYVATTMKDLKDYILSLVDDHLPSQKSSEVDVVPDNPF